MTQLFNHLSHSCMSVGKVKKKKEINPIFLKSNSWIYSAAVGFGRIESMVLSVFPLFNYIYWSSDFTVEEVILRLVFQTLSASKYLPWKEMLARSPVLPHAARSVHVKSTPQRETVYSSWYWSHKILPPIRPEIRSVVTQSGLVGRKSQIVFLLYFKSKVKLAKYLCVFIVLKWIQEIHT